MEEVGQDGLGRVRSWLSRISKKKREKVTVSGGVSDQLVDKETVSRETNLGQMFQTRMSLLSEESLPPVIESKAGVAFLATNENVKDGLVEDIRQAEDFPNGYIFGVGFGNILTMVMLCPENQLPKAILAVDVLLEVVLAGRMFIGLLAEADDFLALTESLRNEEILRKKYEEVLKNEQKVVVKERLEKVSFEGVNDRINKVLSKEYYSQEGIKQGSGDSERICVLAVIKNKFEVLKQLAVEGNIGVAYADMTNLQVLEVVGDMPNFDERRNVVYLSNVIDHLTQRGGDLTRINDMNGLKVLGEGNNWFVDTTQSSLDYQLRFGRHVPVYDEKDVLVGSMETEG